MPSIRPAPWESADSIIDRHLTRLVVASSPTGIRECVGIASCQQPAIRPHKSFIPALSVRAGPDLGFVEQRPGRHEPFSRRQLALANDPSAMLGNELRIQIRL